MRSGALVRIISPHTQKHNRREAFGDVPARDVLVLSEMVQAEEETDALAHMRYGLAAMRLGMGSFGATARSRLFTTSWPVKHVNDIHADDKADLTIEACVQRASEGAFKADGIGPRRDGKLGTIMASRQPTEIKKLRADGTGGPVDLDVRDVELAMGFDLDDTAAEGVSDDDRMRMLGNSIPVRALQHIFRALVECKWLPLKRA